MYPNELFNIFGLSIDLYLICFLVGIIACLVFTILAMKKTGYSSTARDTIIMIGIFAIIIGLLSASLFQAIYNLAAGKGFTFEGMTFIGGLIGGVISFVGIYFLYVYVINPRLKEKSFFKADMNKGIWYLLRIAPISITIAHGFGRIGCLFAGCCHGKVTDEWYGIWNAGVGAKTVPIPLYEAIFLFVLSALMIVLLFRLDFKYNMTLYLISYGIWRFVIEYFRADYRGDFIPGLSPSQFWSIIMVIGGIVIFFLYRYFDPKITKEPEQIENEKSAE
jgi:phosphatidylglycerol:prolipoprotein diacylglycerol transferase